MHNKTVLRIPDENDSGFALISAMLFICVLTVIGIAATNTTSIETTIAGNERQYNQNFYLAEGAAKEAARQNLREAWVWEANKNDLPLDGNNNFDLDQVFTQSSGLGPNVSFGVVDNDIPQGTTGSGHSLKVEGTGTGGRMNFFDLYGRSGDVQSSVKIVLGFADYL